MEQLVLLVFIPTNIIIALVLFLNNPGSWTNRLFAALILVLTLYLTLNTELTLFAALETKLLLSRAIISLGAIINLLVFLFLFAFPKPTVHLKKSILISLLLLTGFLVFAGFTPLIFTGATVSKSGIVPTPGMLFPVFLLHTVALVLGGILTIFLRYRKSIGIEKTRIRYVFLAFVVLFSLVLGLNFIAPVFFKFGNFVPFLPIYILFFNSIVAYAVLRHKLLELRFLVARAVAFTIIILAVGGVYSLSVFIIGARILSFPFSTGQMLFYATLTLIAAFVFHPILIGIERLTDKVLYQSLYNPQHLLKKFSHIMSVTLELDSLTDQILAEVIDTMKITRGIFILISEKEHAVVYSRYSGFQKDVPPHFSFENTLSLMGSGHMLLLDDIAEGSTKEYLKQQHINVVLVLAVSEEKIGMLCLGEKASGQAYSRQDINIFEILAPELSIAIRNSQAYEEIRKFNVTLQQEIRKATQELQDANEKLKVIDKLKDEFVSLASHELRTPMTAIKSYIWMALDGRGGELNDKLKYYLTRAYLSTNRLINLVNDMLNISRIESGRLYVQMQSVDLYKLAQEIVEEVTPRANELGVRVQLTPLTSPLPPVLADPDKIKEVFINLVGNSLKFTPQDGLVKISMSLKGDMVETQVTDTGSGIDPADLPKLFHKFTMLAGSYAGTQSVQGTGLGLYISKSLIDLHKGTITATSEGAGKGATFTFTLRVFRQEDVDKFSSQGNGQMVGIVHTTLSEPFKF